MAQRSSEQFLNEKTLKPFTAIDAHFYKLQSSFELNFEEILPWLALNKITYHPALKMYPFIKLGSAIYFIRNEKTVPIDYELDRHSKTSADGAVWRTQEGNALDAWPVPQIKEFIQQHFQTEELMQ
jgi:hypothetical protein